MITKDEMERFQDEYTAALVLEMFVHTEKRKEKGDSGLTPRGREQAVRMAIPIQYVDNTLAYGGGKKRGMETAALVMQGKGAAIGETDLESLAQQYLMQVGIDRRLDLVMDKESKYIEILTPFYKNKTKPLVFLVEQSDSLAKKHGDPASITYGRAASNISGIVLDNVLRSEHLKDAALQWDFGREQGYFVGIGLYCSHHTIPESLLCRLVQEEAGPRERDKLIESLGNYGFKPGERGYRIVMGWKGDSGPELTVAYRKQNENGSDYMLNEVIPLRVFEEIASCR
jgi:hypothetical protein